MLENFRKRSDYNMDWPESFDFETDETCQTIFRPFIEEQLEELKAYDSKRPDDITYIFHEHTGRVATDMENTCLYMGLSDKVTKNMYWAILPHDIGKKELPVEIWDTIEKPNDELRTKRRTHTLIGAELVEKRFKNVDHPFKTLMIDIMLHHHEQIDGNGTLSILAKELSKPARLSAIVDAYDGWHIWRPHYEDRDISIPGVLKRMREKKGSTFFDMALAEPFFNMKLKEHNQSGVRTH